MKISLQSKFVLSIAVIVFLVTGGSLRASDYVPGELLVKYKPGMYPGHLQGEMAKLGWEKIKVERGKSLPQVMQAFKKDPRIIHVELNYYGRFLSEPNDPDFDKQWYLTNISAPEAWGNSLGTGVIIGLIDSGVDLDHPDLTNNLLTDGWDFGDNDADPSDEHGHGTEVCGVIAAVQNNELGISGTAPASLVLPLKINQGGNGQFGEEAVADAIIFATDYGAKIINLSLGWDGVEPQLVTDAVDYASSMGVLLVAAAGNGSGPVWFPANLEKVIAVGATNHNNLRASYSSYGPELEIMAPGGEFGEFMIYTTNRGGSYIQSYGTSFSAPLVSGVAALMNAGNPALSADQLREYLVQTADDLGAEGKDEFYGYGKVNAYKAVCSVNQGDTYPPGGNNCGDACECEGNFDGDQDQDGADAFTFKLHFGRSLFVRPCISVDPCNGDFSCDIDVDGGDAFIFKLDFGRSPFLNPCPNCATVPWCKYP